MSRLKALTQRAREWHKQNTHEALSLFCCRKKPKSVRQERDGNQSLFNNYQLHIINFAQHHSVVSIGEFSYFCFLNFKSHSGSAGLCEKSAKKAAQITYECSLISEKNWTWVFHLWKKEWQSSVISSTALQLYCIIKCVYRKCKCSHGSIQNIVLQWHSS